MRSKGIPPGAPAGAGDFAAAPFQELCILGCFAPDLITRTD